MNSIKWVNSTTALIAASNSNNQYIGVYQQYTDTIRFINLDYSSNNKFDGIIDLQADDIMAVCKGYIYIVNLNSLRNSQSLYSQYSTYNPQCFKTYSFMDSTNTKLTQYILYKQDTKIQLYKRQISYDSGVITDKSRFSFINELQDLSFNCAFNFYN